MSVKVRLCACPGCYVPVKPGVLACRDHWYALSPRLRDQLVDAWEKRKANPDVPEMVSIHRMLLVQALTEWHIPPEVMQQAMRNAPVAVQTACPWCGLSDGLHRAGCQRVN